MDFMEAIDAMDGGARMTRKKYMDKDIFCYIDGPSAKDDPSMNSDRLLLFMVNGEMGSLSLSVEDFHADDWIEVTS